MITAGVEGRDIGAAVASQRCRSLEVRGLGRCRARLLDEAWLHLHQPAAGQPGLVSRGDCEVEFNRTYEALMAAWLEQHQACLHLIADAGDDPGDAESYYQESLVEWSDSLAALPPSLITLLAVHPPFGLRTAVSALTALTRLELAYTDTATDEEIGTLDLSIAAHHLRPLMRFRQLSMAAVDMSGNADELLSVPALAGLQALELRNCGLQASPPSLFSLTHLTALSLSENLLWTHTSALASLAALQQLQSLDLSGCGLGAVPQQLSALTPA